MRRAALLGLLLAGLSAGLSACESTQDTSKRLSKNAQTLLKVKGVSIARENPDVKVLSTTILRDANGVAAVVALRNAGAAQAKVPILIALSDAKGRRVYTNSIPGLDPSLTRLPVIERGQRTFWVNNQITSARPPRRLDARLGATAAPVPSTLPQITITKLRFGTDTSGVFARGVIANRSKIPQLRLVVSCVSRRGTRITAAGRAIVDKLQPAPTPKPVTFRVYFIGDPKGGALTCAAPPTVLAAGSTS